MANFSGVIRLADEPNATILADMRVFNGRLILSSSGDEIGSWPVDTLTIEETPNGFSLVADGESIILEPADKLGFAGAVGLREVEPAVQSRLEPGTLSSAAAVDADAAWVREQAKTLGPLRQRSAAEWAESDTIDRPVLYGIGIAIIVTVLALAFDWGTGSLIDDIPVERIGFGIIAVALIAALYMAVGARQERRTVGFVVIGGGVIGLALLWLWGRSIGATFAYLLGAVAATVAIVAGALASADWKWVTFPHAPPAEKDQEDRRRSKKRSPVSALRRILRRP